MRSARTAVIDLGLGNIGSVINMIKKTGFAAEAVADAARIGDFERLVLPGVGAFDRGMERLEAGGWVRALEREVRDRGKPILGICLGLQLFCRRSEEGARPGLGWIEADVVRLSPAAPDGQPLRVPHMGWSPVEVRRTEPLFMDKRLNDLTVTENECKFYFLHSFRLRCDHESQVSAVCRYGEAFPCAVVCQNVAGVQFHPEKSHNFGLRLFQNFMRWEGRCAVSA